MGYPLPRTERLPELSFIKWVPSRWLNSSGHAKCTYEVQGIARALFDISTAQSPIGTLPDDDEELAFLLRLPLPHFAALRAMGDRGPVRNWHHCTSDGEIRLMHKVVTECLADVLVSGKPASVQSRTFGESLFVVLLMMLHPTQKLEPQPNPARLRHRRLLRRPRLTLAQTARTNRPAAPLGVILPKALFSLKWPLVCHAVKI